MFLTLQIVIKLCIFRLSEISNAENLQRTAVGTVHEVSFDPQAALMIGHLPAAPGAAPGGILEKIAALTANKNEKTGASPVQNMSTN